MFATVFVATLFTTRLGQLAEAGADPPRPVAHARHVRARSLRRLVPTDPDELYSLRARRRIAAYLRMRMLELREQGLERAADVIEGRSPLRTLFEGEPAPTP